MSAQFLQFAKRRESQESMDISSLSTSATDDYPSFNRRHMNTPEELRYSQTLPVPDRQNTSETISPPTMSDPNRPNTSKSIHSTRSSLFDPNPSPTSPAKRPSTEMTPSISTFSSPKRPLTETEFMERADNAIAYTRSLMEDGDTLVYIKYPGNSILYDPTGFQLTSKAHRVHSQKLLATGSTKFKALLLDDWKQHRMRKAKGFLKKDALPTGIQYVLDLTPPDEGDEAVELTSELSCSQGVRHWYSAEQRCSVHRSLVGGKDEVAMPRHDSLEDTTTSELPTLPPVSNVPVQTNVPTEVENAAQIANEAQFQRVLQRSKEESIACARDNKQFDPEAKERSLKIEEVQEYCPIRHRAGIERLLQVIEGKEPRLDSAPKVWTLFVLSKYFDCTKVVLDFIVSWMLAEPNCQFIEILPEISYKIGNGLQSSLIARPAFAILVSEEALSIASRMENKTYADRNRTNQFLRAKEDIDENSLDAIQAAAHEFHTRILRVFDDLVGSSKSWFKSLPEYAKLLNFLSHCKEDHVARPAVEQLLLNLENYVRGRILAVLTHNLPFTTIREANDHRRAEAYLQRWQGDFSSLYLGLTSRERVLTKFFWQNLRDLGWSTLNYSNALFDHDGAFKKLRRTLAEENGVKEVNITMINSRRQSVNKFILDAIKNEGYHDSHIPRECYSEGQRKYPRQEIGIDIDEYGRPRKINQYATEAAGPWSAWREQSPVWNPSPKPARNEALAAALQVASDLNASQQSDMYRDGAAGAQSSGQPQDDPVWDKLVAEVKADYYTHKIPPHGFDTEDEYIHEVARARFLQNISKPKSTGKLVTDAKAGHKFPEWKDQWEDSSGDEDEIEVRFGTDVLKTESSGPYRRHVLGAAKDKPEQCTNTKSFILDNLDADSSSPAASLYNLPREEYPARPSDEVPLPFRPFQAELPIRIEDRIDADKSSIATGVYNLPPAGFRARPLDEEPLLKKRPFHPSGLEKSPFPDSPTLGSIKIEDDESLFDEKLMSNPNSNSGKVVVSPITVRPPNAPKSNTVQRIKDILYGSSNKPASTSKNLQPLVYQPHPMNAGQSTTSRTDNLDFLDFLDEEPTPKTAPNNGSYNIRNPQVPDDSNILSHSPFFSITRFLVNVSNHVRSVSAQMLSNGEVDFRVLTDTLLCLNENEYKYLPLWAGGNEDGTGGVFDPEMPPAHLGPNGPGPSYHTGYSINSRASTEVDWDGSSVDTSIAVENGYSDHIDRRIVQSDDGFGTSVGFSSDSEDYGGGDFKGKGKVAGIPKPTAKKLVLDDDDDDFMNASDEEADWDDDM